MQKKQESETQLIFKEAKNNIKEIKNNLLEVRNEMQTVDRKLKRLEKMQVKAEEKARKFAESIKEFSAEEKQTAQSVFDEVDSYLADEGKDINFQAAREDYSRTCELYETTQKKIAELQVLIGDLQKKMQGGNISEEDFKNHYEWNRDLHYSFGMELALLNRKAASAVVFQDRIRKTFRS